MSPKSQPASPECAPVRTTCPYCGVGCGIIAKPDGSGGVQILGDPDHPANFGLLCSKGSALAETLSLEGRLLQPMVKAVDGQVAATSWDYALDRVANGFLNAIKRYGPDSVAFYVSGQLLTEDYYVANKLMKGFIGSGNIDSNSRLCMASTVSGHRRAFGSDTVPGNYEDLDEADLLVLAGSNAAWCHPVLHQRMLQNRSDRGAKIVAIDPRTTATARDADLFLQIAPGTDGILFSGLFSYLAAQNAIDRDYICKHTSGFSETLARARHLAPDVEAVADRCQVSLDCVATFYSWFAGTAKTVTLFSQGINQSAQGTDKVNAIINCHLAMGHIGQPGSGPFSLTGQPNAMGGREVGGFASQLAAHMDFDTENLERVRRFWGAPNLADKPGLEAVELFDAVAQGRIKALWIMATNPAVSLPRADTVRAALKTLELLVVSDVVARTDTISANADVCLPAAAWGEKDGTVTNSERRISRQRAFTLAAADAKPDWWIVAQVAKRMGFESAFDFNSASDVFREHAALTAFENNGTRTLDLSGLADLSDDAYAELEPIQWPVRRRAHPGAKRVFANRDFSASDRRARFIAIRDVEFSDATRPGLPLLLNTGRVRDQWHTMTRSGKSPRLSACVDEPFVSVHPIDVARFSLANGGFARITTMHGTTVLRVRESSDQRIGEVFAPIHWSAENSSDGRVGALVQAACDPISGQPELKATAASLAPFVFATHGFVLSRADLKFPSGTWWARSVVKGGFGYRMTTTELPSQRSSLTRELLGTCDGLIELNDEAQSRYRAAIIRDGQLHACVFLASDPATLPSWEWLKSELAMPQLSASARRSLLAGRSPDAGVDHGAICSCIGGSGPIEICDVIGGG